MKKAMQTKNFVFGADDFREINESMEMSGNGVALVRDGFSIIGEPIFYNAVTGGIVAIIRSGSATIGRNGNYAWDDRNGNGHVDIGEEVVPKQANTHWETIF